MAVLELHHVDKSFGSGHKKVEALKNTDFHADRGELIAIIGPSGSGRVPSSLLWGGYYHQLQGT
jgi:putative ABC transport system ATP-binding protein